MFAIILLLGDPMVDARDIDPIPPQHSAIKAPPIPPPMGKARVAIPANAPGTWVTQADYPVLALRNLEEGAVGFALTIDKRGRPTGCTVTSSSRSAILDETTCRLVASRARFTPARDAKGRVTEGSYRNRIVWRIPLAPPPPPPDAVI